MNIDTLRVLTNLAARFDLSELSQRVTEGDLTPDDADYLTEHGKAFAGELSDITDFCSHWHVSAVVAFAGKDVATVSKWGKTRIID